MSILVVESGLVNKERMNRKNNGIEFVHIMLVCITVWCVVDAKCT